MVQTAERRVKRGGSRIEEGGERIVRKRVSSLKPCPENLLLYSPINRSDPEFIKFAKAIDKNGCTPLDVTEDNYIMGGHRRHEALLFNGQAIVSCRVLHVRYDSMTADEVLELLRSLNHQRHKTPAEQVREELIDINPEDAHRELRRLRDKSIRAPEHNGVAIVAIEGQKKRYRISEEKADHVKYIKQIVFIDRKDYWPLSVRAVHYPLLNFQFMRNLNWRGKQLPYQNDSESYQATSDLITRMRLNRELPWEAFDDATRPLTEFRPFQNVREFLRHEVSNLFTGYWRDLLQTQPNCVEVLCEKNTIYHMVLRVTEKYQIFTSSGRGFNSIDPYHDLHQRYLHSGKKGLIVIVLSDFDPEGEMIPIVAGRTLRDDFHVDDLKIIKSGVTRKQIEQHHLREQNFAKESSSNWAWFVKRNGGNRAVYELEALEPANMMADLDNVIRSVIDVDLFNREKAIEEQESAYWQAARTTAVDALKGLTL